MAQAHKNDIKQLAEMYVMMSRGEFSQDAFLRAFKVRFSREIQTVVEARKKRENYGWKTIDWERLEAHPLLKELLV